MPSTIKSPTTDPLRDGIEDHYKLVADELVKAYEALEFVNTRLYRPADPRGPRRTVGLKEAHDARS